jgi:hypothetical protein
MRKKHSVVEWDNQIHWKRNILLTVTNLQNLIYIAFVSTAPVPQIYNTTEYTK